MSLGQPWVLRSFMCTASERLLANKGHYCARGISGKTIRNSFRHQRRTSNFHILLAGLVMRPPIRTKISQPTPQSRCIGFGPGEPCRQAFSVGGAETAVGRHAVLPCERPIVPAITGHSAAIMNAGCVSPIGNSAIRVSIITASLQSINREFGRVAICPILVWGAACCMEKEEAKWPHPLRLVRRRGRSPGIQGRAFG